MLNAIRTGDLFYANTIAELMNQLFNTNLRYRATYFNPTRLHKCIPGGFYIWIDKFTEDGHIHDLGNGIIWKNMINNSRSEISKTFVGKRSCLTDDIMDMHGMKILVFLDKRPKQKVFEFLGVFGESGVVFTHNCFEGISYVKINDELIYNRPNSKPTA